MRHTASKTLVAAACAGLLALAGCGERTDGQTVGQKVDNAIANTAEAGRDVAQGAREATADAGAAARQAGTELREAGREVAQDTRQATAEVRTDVMGAAAATKEAVSNAGERVGNAVDDAQITATVKTGLAADKNLAATRIDVDTKNGVVTLSGNAPSQDASRRATEIARNVKDVRSVNNQLKVGAAG